MGNAGTKKKVVVADEASAGPAPPERAHARRLIARIAANETGLTDCDLSLAGLVDADAVALARALAANRVVESCDASGNAIGGEGARALLAALRDGGGSGRRG